MLETAMDDRTLKNTSNLRKVWREVENGTLYVVTNDREYLVEGPEQRQDRQAGEEGEDVAVLRVWPNFEDAWLYCEVQRANYDADEAAMQVAKTKLDHLFGLIGVIRRNAKKEFGCEVRIDLCRIHDGEPVLIDTISSAAITTH